MKRILILMILFANKGLAQEEKLLKDISIDSSTVLVGMYSDYDLKKTYQHYNFYISNLHEIDSVKNIIKYGEKFKVGWMDNAGFQIKLLKKDTLVQEWQIYPKYSNIVLKGASWSFDLNILKSLSDKYHFEYTNYKKTFANKPDYDIFYFEMIKDPQLVYIKQPNFNIEGTFEVQFFKNEKFSSPKAIMDYIKSKFKEDKTGKYYLSYIANKYNLDNNNQFTITIESSKQFYDLFNDTESKKSVWTPEEFSATIFKKVN